MECQSKRSWRSLFGGHGIGCAGASITGPWSECHIVGSLPWGSTCSGRLHGGSWLRAPWFKASPWHNVARLGERNDFSPKAADAAPNEVPNKVLQT